MTHVSRKGKSFPDRAMPVPTLLIVTRCQDRQTSGPGRVQAAFVRSALAAKDKVRHSGLRRASSDRSSMSAPFRTCHPLPSRTQRPRVGRMRLASKPTKLLYSKDNSHHAKSVAGASSCGINVTRPEWLIFFVFKVQLKLKLIVRGIVCHPASFRVSHEVRHFGNECGTKVLAPKHRLP